MSILVDCKLYQNNTGQYDIRWNDDGDFSMTSTLDTAALLSLTNERRAKDYEINDPKYRRGWIGNLLYKNTDHEDGCGNWLYEQKRLNSKTVNGVRDESEKGLLWMVSDDLAKTIEVKAVIKDSRIVLHYTIHLIDDTYLIDSITF